MLKSLFMGNNVLNQDLHGKYLSKQENSQQKNDHVVSMI